MIIIQSYTDLITNSSTTVYQFANNVESVKEIIDSILKITGTSYTCDDLFDIKISYDITLWDAEDYYVSKAQRLEDPVVKELLNKYINSNYANFEYLENLYNYLVTNCGEMDLNTWAKSGDTNYDSFYTFVAKDPVNAETANTLGMINNLFGYESEFDG